MRTAVIPHSWLSLADAGWDARFWIAVIDELDKELRTPMQLSEIPIAEVRIAIARVSQRRRFD